MDYEPIDWQLDFKSGYRWSDWTWYRVIRCGNIRGADVKVPWELGRLQHLPQLALAATVAIANLEMAHKPSGSRVSSRTRYWTSSPRPLLASVSSGP